MCVREGRGGVFFGGGGFCDLSRAVLAAPVDLCDEQFSYACAQSTAACCLLLCPQSHALTLHPKVDAVKPRLMALMVLASTWLFASLSKKTFAAVELVMALQAAATLHMATVSVEVVALCDG